MGNGITQKIAIIVNGDTDLKTSSDNLSNVNLAIKRYQQDGFNQIYVVSTQAHRIPQDSSIHYTNIHDGQQALDNLLKGLKEKTDDDDVLSIYTTGHGDIHNGRSCIDIPKSCYPIPRLLHQIDQLQYGYRTIFMDQCYSGQEAYRFVNPKTTLLAVGSPGETVSCQLFTPKFFSDLVPDINRDGIISMRERFEYAIQGYDVSTVLFYSPGLPTDLAGRQDQVAPFLPQTNKVDNAKALDESLRQLKPGHLALVNFSSEDCAPCREYKPHFEKLATQYKGNFLMVRAENKHLSQPDWLKYGITTVPAVAFIDWQGNIFPVEDRNNPIASL